MFGAYAFVGPVDNSDMRKPPSRRLGSFSRFVSEVCQTSLITP